MIRKIKKLFKSKRQRLEDILDKIAPVYIKAPDCDDEIVIAFGLDEAIRELKQLLQSGVGVKRRRYY